MIVFEQSCWCFCCHFGVLEMIIYTQLIGAAYSTSETYSHGDYFGNHVADFFAGANDNHTCP